MFSRRLGLILAILVVSGLLAAVSAAAYAQAGEGDSLSPDNQVMKISSLHQNQND